MHYFLLTHFHFPTLACDATVRSLAVENLLYKLVPSLRSEPQYMDLPLSNSFSKILSNEPCP